MQAVTQPTLFDVLLTLFYSLRQHNFSLGIAEFKLALQAFSYGFGCESESDMVFTLQVLWGKSYEEQEELRRMLLNILAEKREAEAEAAAAQPTSDPDSFGTHADKAE